jgi:outer membrane protein
MEVKVKKKIIAILILSLFLFGVVNAQNKIGYVDSQRILQELPEYKDALKKLEDEYGKWQQEFAVMQKDFEEKRQQYESQKLLLSDEKKNQKEKELQDLLVKIQQYQQDKLGPTGEYYQKNSELSKPIIEKIQAAINKVAINENYDFIFDASTAVLLYGKPKYDITDLILQELNKGKGKTTAPASGKK